MADTNPTSQASGGAITGSFPPPPPIPSGEEVYDTIMSKIEPELTTSQLPVLKDKYKDETPEAAKARAERYAKAFEEYDKQYAVYMQSQAAAVSAFQSSVHQSAEHYSHQKEIEQLGSIESAITTS